MIKMGDNADSLKRLDRIMFKGMDKWVVLLKFNVQLHLSVKINFLIYSVK